MKHFILYVPILIILFSGCTSNKAGKTEPVQDPIPIESVDEGIFDPGSISQEIFDNTKSDVQRFIADLNAIIRSKNYAGWKAALSDAYFEEISSPEYLKNTSEQPALKRMNITLKSPVDYFNYVVVPSRANSKVDDIEFLSEHCVKVFTIDPRHGRLRLYELEQTGNTWKINN
jgi:hypothetical protein